MPHSVPHFYNGRILYMTQNSIAVICSVKNMYSPWNGVKSNLNLKAYFFPLIELKKINKIAFILFYVTYCFLLL